MIASLPEKQRNKFFDSLTEEEARALEYNWNFWWARPKQRIPEGDWSNWLIRAGRGWGKRIDIEKEIPTIDGWKKLKHIKKGDTIFDNKGKPTEVLNAHSITKVNKGYELIFDTGETIKADPEHLWFTQSKLERKRKDCNGSVKTTEEIINSIKYKNRETNHRIPVIKPIKYPKKDLSIKPYTLGIWLGDGDSKNFCITTEDKKVLEYIKQDGYTIGNVFDGNKYSISNNSEIKRNNLGQYISNNSLYSKLKKLSIYQNKHIPQKYLEGDVYQRTELLKGLMDSDGYADKSNGWCEFTTINKQLSNQVLQLVSSLGIKARIYKGDATLNGKETSKKYRVKFKTGKKVFKLDRKQSIIDNSTNKQMSRHKNRFIVDYKVVKNIKMRCLTVDSPNGLFLVGRSYITTHNTRTGAETVRQWVKNKVQSIALIGETPADVRDIMIEGESGLLNIFPPDKKPNYIPSKRKIIFNNGVEAHIYSGANPDQLRGPQHEKAWADELASWDYPQETWDNLMFGLRLGENPQTIITTTPRPIKIIRKISKNTDTIITTGSTYANKANLPSSFYKKIVNKYEGTRLGRQEIHAEVLSDSPGALWSYDLFKYVDRKDMPNLKRIVVAIDPAVSNTEKSDETGIIVAGLGVDNRGYILHDGSGMYSPSEWASRAIALYKKFSADKIVGEVNQGGDMVESTLRSVNKNISYKQVRASRGKQLRAEPVSSLYEQEKVFHKKQFNKLEDQLCTWQPGEDSPDRLDALVWALTELMLDEAGPRIRSL